MSSSQLKLYVFVNILKRPWWGITNITHVNIATVNIIKYAWNLTLFAHTVSCCAKIQEKVILRSTHLSTKINHYDIIIILSWKFKEKRKTNMKNVYISRFGNNKSYFPQDFSLTINDREIHSHINLPHIGQNKVRV